MKLSGKHLVTWELWQRNLIVISLAEIVAISGFAVFMPFLPYYVQELGITRLEEVGFWSGLLLSVQGITMAVTAPMWGSLADRYGRKIMVVRAMFGSAIVITLMGFTQNVWQLLALRALQGVLTGTVAAATTLVASGTPAERRGYAMGVLQMAIYLGVSAGPMLGGFVADNLGYRATFWVTGGLLFSAGMLVTLLVHEKFVSPERTGDSKKSHLWDGLLLGLRSKSLMVVFGIRMLMSTSMRAVGPILPLFIQQMVPDHTRLASVTGTIEGLAATASAVSAVILGRISDRIGSKRILLICGAAGCVLSVLMSRAQNPTQVLILRALGGVAMGGILATISALLAAMVPQDRFGAIYGVDTAMVSVANAIAPMFGAMLAATWGLSSAFLGAAAMFGLATAIIALSIQGKTRETSP